MSRKIIWVLILVLVVGSVLGNGGVKSPEKYTYDKFKTDFASNPTLAAEQHPQEYMKHIQENPQAVKENPQAYEKVISQNTKYINQNKEAFQSYAETKGVKFDSVKGDFKSFNSQTGMLVTKGPKGESVSSFTLDTLKILSKVHSGLKITKDGKLRYNPNKIPSLKGQVTLNGKLETKNQAIYLTEGVFSIEGNKIELNNENIAIISDTKCTAELICKVVSLESKTGVPINLPEGKLLNGYLTIYSYGNNNLKKPRINILRLDSDTEYQDKQGAIFEVDEVTTIIPSKGGCSLNVISNHNCIEIISTKSQKEIFVQQVLKNSKIKINVEDGAYKNIVIAQIKKPLVKLGRYLKSILIQDELYVDREGNLFNEKGSLIGDISHFPEIASSSAYQEAHAQAKKQQSGQAEIVLERSGKLSSVILFDDNKPLLLGSLNSLKSNIGHVFESQSFIPSISDKVVDKITNQEWTRLPDGRYKLTIGKEYQIGRYIPGKGLVISEVSNPKDVNSIGQVLAVLTKKTRYPWMTFNGKPSVNVVGKTSVTLTDEIIRTAIKKSNLELKQILKITGDLDTAELTTIVKSSADKIGLSTLESIIEQQPLNKQLEILSTSNSQTATKLQNKILTERKVIGAKEIAEVLTLTKQNPELQKSLLSRTNQIMDPGKALESVNSDELKKIIIGKSKIIGDSTTPYSQLKQQNVIVGSYLSQLEKLNPELQKLALTNLDYEKGVFAHQTFKGMAVRKILEFAYQHEKNNPTLMKNVLSIMPKKEDIGFNPKIFSKVYFDKNFQKATEEMDFANKQSVALTTQRYLERDGDQPTSENIKKVIDLVMDYRDIFSKHVILDKNTYFIPISNEEQLFNPNDLVKIARDSGVKKIADPTLKGSKDIEKAKKVKQSFLSYVEKSNTQEKTTIYFNVHGGPKHQSFASGFGSFESSDDLHKPGSISYVELGDVLAKRGKLSEVTIITESCNSNDYKNNLYVYLAKKGIKEHPIFITVTNRGQLGISDVFKNAFKKTHQKGKPLTGADIMKNGGIESETFITQDLSVTVPLNKKEDKKYSDPKTPQVLDLGSTYDDGNAEKPKRTIQETEQSKGKTSVLPPTVFEIAQLEPEMQQRIG